MTTISRRDWLKYLGALAAGGVVANVSGCAAPKRKLVVTAGAWPGYEPLFLARHQGWLDPEQIRLGEVPSNASSIHALATGVADAAALTLDEVLMLRSQGIALTIVLVFNISAGADMLLARPEIGSLAELKGKRVAIEQGTYAPLLLDTALAAAGLRRADVTTVHLPIGDQMPAWRKGEIDAAVTYAPFADELVAAGAHRLFDSRQMPDTIVDVLAVRNESLSAGGGDALRHLLAAHFRTLAFLADAPDDAARLIGARRRSEAVAVASAYDGLILPDLEKNRLLLAGAQPVLLEKARLIGEAMRGAGLLSGSDDLNGLVNGDYLPASGKEGER